MSRRQNTMLSRRWAGDSGGDPSVIYELYNYVCDGTSATALDTGIKLFNTTAFPNGFIVELNVTPNTWSSMGSIMRCRSSASGYYGFHLRYTSNRNQVTVACNPGSRELTANIGMGNPFTVVINYRPLQLAMSLGNQTGNWSMLNFTIDDTFCIGGEKEGNGNWKSGRFAAATINSLKVIDVSRLS